MVDTSASLLERLGDRTDAEAWRRFLGLYAPLIRHWLRRHDVPPLEMDDLVQDVLAVVVRELPHFRHNQRTGAFRAWLRSITTNRLRQAWRARRLHPEATGGTDFAAVLDQLEDPDSDLSRLWDREHDHYLVHRLLAWIEPEVQPSTWHAFRRLVLESGSADAVAADLGISVNAVFIAKSRVLQRLRRHALGLIEE